MNLEAFSRVGKLGLDTAPLFYLVERPATYGPLVRALVERAERGGLELISSTLTLTEVLSVPLERGDETIVGAYRSILLRSPYLQLRAIDIEVAERAARLRALHLWKTPDALQVAVACQAGCDAFLTNDCALPRVTEVDVLVPADLV